MAVNRRIAVALSTMWASRAITIALGLLLVPVLFHRLSGSELGTWLLLGQAGSIVGFMDFGMTNVLARLVAFASGDPDEPASTSRDLQLGELIASAKRLYRAAAAFALVVALCGGWLFLSHIVPDADALARARTTWIVLCFGFAIQLSGGLWSAVVSGLGLVATAAMIGTVFSIGTLALMVATVLLGGGMVSLAVVMLISSAAQRYATIVLLRRREPKLMALRCYPKRTVVTALLVPSLKYWLTEVGAVLLLRTDQLFIASFQDPAQIPAYYAAYSLIYNLALISMNIGDASFVYVSKLWREYDPRTVHSLVIRNARIGLGVMVSGVAVMASIGDAVITVWLGPGHFVGWPVLLTFCAMLVLFVQQSLLLGFSRATENESYAPCYLLAGALNIGITWTLAGRLGLLGVALGTLLAQVLTTNWFIPRSGLRRLRIAWPAYVAEVLGPVSLTFVATYVAVFLATHSVPTEQAFARVAIGSVTGLASVCVCFWTLIFDAPIRDYAREEAWAFAICAARWSKRMARSA